MKVKFEIKGLKVEVDGDVPAAVVELVEKVAEAALVELAKIKATAAIAK